MAMFISLYVYINFLYGVCATLGLTTPQPSVLMSLFVPAVLLSLFFFSSIETALLYALLTLLVHVAVISSRFLECK